MIAFEEPFLYIGIWNIIGGILAWRRNKGDIPMTLIGFLLGALYCIYWVCTKDDYEN